MEFHHRFGQAEGIGIFESARPLLRLLVTDLVLSISDDADGCHHLLWIHAENYAPVAVPHRRFAPTCQAAPQGHSGFRSIALDLDQLAKKRLQPAALGQLLRIGQRLVDELNAHAQPGSVLFEFLAGKPKVIEHIIERMSPFTCGEHAGQAEGQVQGPLLELFVFLERPDADYRGDRLVVADYDATLA